MVNFKKVSAIKSNANYSSLIKREASLYNDNSKIRSPFERDYTRIIHSTAYRRLKHKTQVFYNVGSDHVCTRMEHVLHVESVSYTISKRLGLNEELTRAIAIGHDLGHAPFGHYGEEVIKEITEKYLNETFFHEKNGLYFADNIELLPNHDNKYQNLNLTYGVRDGIISHCGEVDNSAVKPREQFISLPNDFCLTGQYNAITYEGCVVKLSDKIAYVGRDIEDALSLGFLNSSKVQELNKIVNLKNGKEINTSTIIGEMIGDVCLNSTIEKGICLSFEMAEKLDKIKKFNYENIYSSTKFNAYKKYASLIINQLFTTLLDYYKQEETICFLLQTQNEYPTLLKEFNSYLCKYVNPQILPNTLKRQYSNYQNKKIYECLQTQNLYVRAIVDYLSGMTDRYIVECFNELITF